MTELIPNAELAYRVLDTARFHQALDMRNWVDGPVDRVGLADLTAKESCGTTACLAGWTAALVGYQVNSDGRVFDKGTDIGNVQSVAASLLRIDGGDSERLFFTHEHELDSLVTDIFGPRPGGAA